MQRTHCSVLWDSPRLCMTSSRKPGQLIVHQHVLLGKSYSRTPTPERGNSLSNQALLDCLVLSCRSKRRGALPPPLNPETATLGSVALQHLRNLKIKQCTEELHSIGFIEGAAEMARKCGGDTNVAAQYLAEGRQTSSPS